MIMRLFLPVILISCFNYCAAQSVNDTARSGMKAWYIEMYDLAQNNLVYGTPDSVKHPDLYSRLRSFISEHPKNEDNFTFIYKLAINLSYRQASELLGLIDSSIQHSPSSAWADVTLKRLSVAETGKPFPALALTDTSGNELILSSLKGKVVLLDVWSSWCIPCREQIPELRKLYKKYNSRGFEMIGISMDDDKEKWLTAIKKDKQIWKAYCELTNWRANKFAARFHTYAIPVNFLIDEKGILAGQDLEPESIGKWLAQHL